MEMIMENALEPLTPDPSKKNTQIKPIHHPTFNQTMPGGVIARTGTCEIDACGKPGGHCKVKYCSCIILGCNRVVCEDHRSDKWFLESKNKRPRICYDCENKVQPVSYLLCFIFPTLVILCLVGMVILIHYKSK